MRSAIVTSRSGPTPSLRLPVLPPRLFKGWPLSTPFSDAFGYDRRREWRRCHVEPSTTPSTTFARLGTRGRCRRARARRLSRANCDAACANCVNLGVRAAIPSPHATRRALRGAPRHSKRPYGQRLRQRLLAATFPRNALLSHMPVTNRYHSTAPLRVRAHVVRARRPRRTRVVRQRQTGRRQATAHSQEMPSIPPGPTATLQTCSDGNLKRCCEVEGPPIGPYVDVCAYTCPCACAAGRRATPRMNRLLGESSLPALSVAQAGGRHPLTIVRSRAVLVSCGRAPFGVAVSCGAVPENSGLLRVVPDGSGLSVARSKARAHLVRGPGRARPAARGPGRFRLLVVACNMARAHLTRGAAPDGCVYSWRAAVPPRRESWVTARRCSGTPFGV